MGRELTRERTNRALRKWFGVVLGSLLLVAAACGSDDTASDDPAVDGASDTTTTATAADGDGSTSDGETDVETTTTTVSDRPDGPTAELTELSADGETFIGSPEPFEPDPGYVQQEFAVAGTATSYTVDGELTEDGEWTFVPGEEADYRTRIVVRRPGDPDDFSGTVVVEWLNVSGGVDADPEWTSLREEIVRQGAAWVGLSAQRLGVEGGPVLVAVDVEGAADVAGSGLKNIDPDRYGDLSHPGDAFANDILTQVGRAIWAGDALGDLEPERVIAAGESQSAFALVTYINGVHPLTEVFDGYFVHSRGPAGFPVLAPGDDSADIAGSLAGAPTIFRTDLDVPVFDIQAENDVVGIFGSFAVRQPDSDSFRLWEIAGTAHADLHLMGESTAAVIDCGAPINDGPMHVVAKAAFAHLVDWVESGTPPPESPRLELASEDPGTLARDEDGIVLGGVRTPPVDVPAQTLSGEAGPTPDTICLLSGSTLPIPDERLAELYDSPADYEEQFAAALDAAIADAFILEGDRAAAEGYARPDVIPA